MYLSLYQNTIYSAIRIRIKPAAPILNTQSVLKSSFFNSIAPGWFFFDSSSEITIITALIIKNTIPILSRKGSNGKIYFKRAETGMLIAAAISTEFDVARFQNNP